MVNGVVDIMPESSSKEDEMKAIIQKMLIDELLGEKDNGVIKALIDEELKKL